MTAPGTDAAYKASWTVSITHLCRLCVRCLCAKPLLFLRCDQAGARTRSELSSRPCFDASGLRFLQRRTKEWLRQTARRCDTERLWRRWALQQAEAERSVRFFYLHTPSFLCLWGRDSKSLKKCQASVRKWPNRVRSQPTGKLQDPLSKTPHFYTWHIFIYCQNLFFFLSKFSKHVWRSPYNNSAYLVLDGLWGLLLKAYWLSFV